MTATLIRFLFDKHHIILFWSKLGVVAAAFGVFFQKKKLNFLIILNLLPCINE